MTLYLLDFDNQGRCETLTLSGGTTGTQQICNFSGGVYVTVQLSGNTKITVTSQSGPNSTVSGIMFS